MNSDLDTGLARVRLRIRVEACAEQFLHLGNAEASTDDLNKVDVGEGEVASVAQHTIDRQQGTVKEVTL